MFSCSLPFQASSPQGQHNSGLTITYTAFFTSRRNLGITWSSLPRDVLGAICLEYNGGHTDSVSLVSS